MSSLPPLYAPLNHMGAPFLRGWVGVVGNGHTQTHTEVRWMKKKTKKATHASPQRMPSGDFFNSLQCQAPKDNGRTDGLSGFFFVQMASLTLSPAAVLLKLCHFLQKHLSVFAWFVGWLVGCFPGFCHA